MSVACKYEVNGGSSGPYTVYETYEAQSKEEFDSLLAEINRDPSKTLINSNSKAEDQLIINYNDAFASLKPLIDAADQQPHLPSVEVKTEDVQLLLSIKEENKGDAPAAAPPPPPLQIDNGAAPPPQIDNGAAPPPPPPPQIDNGAAPVVNEGGSEYNDDGSYRHNGRKEPYAPFGSNVGEGEKVLTLFATLEFEKLKRNFAFIKNADPLYPDTRRITLNDLYGDGPIRKYVNPAFWAFVISEYTFHQRVRIVRGEERTNGWKKGGSKRWRAQDFTSEMVNNERLPPHPDAYKPPLGFT